MGNEAKRIKIMRVLFVTGSYPPMLCGVGDYTLNLVSQISEKGGITVGVVTSVAAGTNGVLDNRVELHPIVHGWRFRELPKIIRVIRRWRPDIVHFQYPTLGYGTSRMPHFMPLLLKTYGLKIVQTWHEPPTPRRFLPNALTKDILIGVEPDFLQKMGRRYAWLIRRKAAHFISIGSNITRVDLTEAERAEIRTQYVGPDKAMIVYFGFVFVIKGVEMLFEIADPSKDKIVLISNLDVENNPYHKNIMECANNRLWAGKVVVTGFLSAENVARVLCAADAAVFPFTEGVGRRNGSFLAARVQGTFTLTTSRDRQGYDSTGNVYYASPGDVKTMREALSQYKGKRSHKTSNEPSGWSEIADRHISLYHSILS